MAHTNSTPNYHLPQFVSSDKPAWLVDVNAAYADIDTGMKRAQDTADDAKSDATQALLDASTASSTATSADAKASGAIASLANTFSNTNTYDVGDYVIYNNILYRCTVAVITPGPWSGTLNWTRASIGSIIDDANSYTDDQIDALNASNIPFDENASIADKISETNNLFKLVEFSSEAKSVNANGVLYFSAADYNYQVPEGYTLVALLSLRMSNDNFYTRYFLPSNLVVAKNTANSQQTTSVSLTCLFVKSSFV